MPRGIPGALPAAAATGGGASAPGGMPDIRYSTARSGLLYAALIALTTSSLGKPMSTICKSTTESLYGLPHVASLMLAVLQLHHDLDLECILVDTGKLCVQVWYSQNAHTPSMLCFKLSPVAKLDAAEA